MQRLLLRSCWRRPRLAVAGKVREHLEESGQRPVLAALVEMIKSGDIADACAASEVVLMLMASRTVRSLVVESGAVDAMFRLVCDEVTHSLTGGGASSSAAVRADSAAGGSSDLCWLPEALLSNVAGAASLAVPEQVSRRTLAELMEAADRVASALPSDPLAAIADDPSPAIAAAPSAGAAHETPLQNTSAVIPQAIRAVGIRRCLALLVNLTASAEGTPAVLRAMKTHESRGAAAVLGALSSLAPVPGLQVTALKVLSNIAADIATGSTAAAPPTAGLAADAAVAAAAPLTTPAAAELAPGPETDALLIKLVCPLVRCACRTPRAVGGWGAEQLLRLVSVLGSCVAPAVASKQVQPAGVAGKVSLTHIKVAEAVMSAGAVRVLSAALVECSDRLNRLEAALRAARPQVQLTPQQQGQIAAADETVKGAARVLNTLSTAFPGVKEEVERIAEEMAALASHGTATAAAAPAAATSLPATVQEEDEEEENDAEEKE